MLTTTNVRLMAALGILILVCYSNSFTAQLTVDSRYLVGIDSRVHALTWDNVTAILTTDYWYPLWNSHLYRPLTTGSYLLNYSLGGGNNPLAYHAINFVLHWANASLVFLLALALFERRIPALLTAAVFAVHPVTTEAVTYIAGRADLLAAASVLGGLLLYVRSKSAWSIVLLAVVALAGVLAKEDAIVLLAIMALYDLVFRRRPIKAAYAAVFGVFVCVGLIRWMLFRDTLANGDSYLENPLLGASFWTSRMTAIGVIGKYVWMLVWPSHLSINYAFNQIPMFRWSDWRAVAQFATVALLVIASLLMYRRSRIISFSAGWFALALLPAANLLILIGTIMADRFLYLPLFGFAAVVVFAVMKLLPESAATALLAIAIVALGIRTYIRNRDWKDELSLWSAAEQVSPNSYATHLWLASALATQSPGNSGITSAVQEAEKAAAIVDTLPKEQRKTSVYVQLADYYRTKGKTLTSPEEQRVWYRKSLDLLNSCIPSDELLQKHPADSSLYVSLGQTLMVLGDQGKAIDALLNAQRPDPLNALIAAMIGDAYAAGGDLEQAAIFYHESLMLQPGSDLARRVRGKLKYVYGRVDKLGCAIDIDGQLDAFCGTVRDKLCSTRSRLVDLLRAEKRFDAAQRIDQAAKSEYGCR